MYIIFKQYTELSTFFWEIKAGTVPVYNFVHPGDPLAARRALSARLVLVEHDEARDGLHDVGGAVHDYDGGGAQRRLRAHQRVEVHQHVGAHAAHTYRQSS